MGRFFSLILSVSKEFTFVPYLAHTVLNSNQIWVIDATLNALYVHKSKVTYKGQKSSEFKL